MALTIVLKTTSGKKWEVQADEDLTIEDVKAISEDVVGIDCDEFKLIYKGRVLKDPVTLGELKFKSGQCMIVHKRRNKSRTSSPSPAKSETSSEPTTQSSNSTPLVSASPSTPATNASPSTPATNPFAAFQSPSTPATNPFAAFQSQAASMQSSGGTNPFASMMGMGGGNFQQMQQQIMQNLQQNPQMMQEMMSSPMVQGMLSNPDVLSSIFESNPQLRGMLEQNPQLRQMLSNPDVMNQAMAALRDPNEYQRLMRDHDRTLANIEARPGGASALERMYTTMQAPMQEALQDMNASNRSTTVIRQPSVDANSSGPTSEPLGAPAAMPNPNSSSTSPSTSSSTASAPTNANPFQSMASNPMMMQMMQQMMQGGNGASNTGAPLPTMPQNSVANLTNMFGAMQPNTVNLQQTYATELNQLNSMGFSDQQRNIAALQATGGNVQAAVDRLINQA